MNTPSELKIKKGTHIGPKNGWKPQTYYIVQVSFGSGNPIHKAIFYSGFITDSKPCGYNTIFNPSYDENYDINRAYYMKVIEELNINLKEE
jgi:hypothetical protein